MNNYFFNTNFSRCAALLLVLVLCAPAAMANLVRNGAFNEPGAVTTPQPPISRPDNRIPSWQMRAEWYVDESEVSPLPGAQVLRAEGGNAHRDLRQYVYLEPGKPYTMSAWIKAKGITRTSANLGDNQTGILLTDWRWTQKRTLGLDGKDLSDWQRYAVTFVAPEANVVGGVVQPAIVRLFLPKGEEGTLWVTGIQIEEGEQLGDFEFIASVQRREALEDAQKLAVALGDVMRNLIGFEGREKAGMQDELQSLLTSLTSLAERLENHSNSGDWEVLMQELARVRSEANPYLQPMGWWSNPWDNLPLRALPELGAMGVNEVHITRAVNDYGALLLPLANLTPETIPVEVRVGDEIAPLSTQSTFVGPIKVSTVYWVSNEGYVSSLSPVKDHQKFPYFLQPLPSSNTTLLPSNETTQLWMDVDTNGMEPGTYRYPVKLIGLNRDYTWEGEIVLTVLPVTLPQKVPTNVMAYSNMPFYMEPFSPHSAEKPILNYTPEERLAMAQPWLNAWKEMGFNRLMLTNHFIKYEFNRQGELAAPVDYAAFDAYLELWSDIADEFWAGWNLAAYHIYRNWRDLSKAKFDSVSRNRTEAVLKSFIDHAKSKGLTPESMPISLFDEPHGKRVDVTRQGVEALKKVAPDWKTMAAISGTDRSHIESLIPLLDIFVVRQRMGQMDMKPETIAYLKQNGKEVWGYACSGSFEYLHPYRYFRLLPWQSWSNGLSGYALYMTILHTDYPKIGARSSFFSPLFLGKDGPVIGRGARGFQLGGRDWAVFAMAKELLEQERTAGRRAQKLEDLLGRSIAGVLSEEEDSSLADRVRDELLQEIVRIQSVPQGGRSR